MRPRVFPAEDGDRLLVHATSYPCFNEAAGIPRGRLTVPPSNRYLSGASMRPRVFPAEDPKFGDRVPGRSKRFNEAAGIPRGRPTRTAASFVVTSRFNEAAGIPRGRLMGGELPVALAAQLQ